jgi:hypothetical protein
MKSDAVKILSLENKELEPELIITVIYFTHQYLTRGTMINLPKMILRREVHSTCNPSSLTPKPS